jgi:serine/threonine protein kinase
MTEPRTVDERELDELRTMASSADPTQAYKLGNVVNTWYVFLSSLWPHVLTRACRSGVKIYDAKSLSANGPVRVKITDLTGVMHSNLVLNELRTMRAMQEAGSPNIVALRDAYVSGKDVWLVTEDLAGGSLVDLIERKKKLEENQIAYIAREVCDTS